MSDSRPERIVDFRFRVPTAPFAAAAATAATCVWWRSLQVPLWRPEHEPDRGGRPDTLEACLAWMADAGVVGVLPGRDLPCTTVPNDHLAELCRDHPGRFVALAGLDPSNPAACLAEAERALGELGFVGVHLEVGWLRPPMHPDDRRLYPLYELCAQAGAVVVVHVGPIAGPELAHTDPTALCRVARDFPRARFVMAHAAYPNVDAAILAVLKHDNVWLGPDPYLGFPGGDRYHQWAHHSEVVADRMLYGSSFGWPQAPDALERFLQMGWRHDVAERVLWSNGAALLGLR